MSIVNSKAGNAPARPIVWLDIALDALAKRCTNRKSGLGSLQALACQVSGGMAVWIKIGWRIK